MGMMQMLVLPLSFLSGALYPITNLPTWLETLTLINPVTYAVHADPHHGVRPPRRPRRGAAAAQPADRVVRLDGADGGAARRRRRARRGMLAVATAEFKGRVTGIVGNGGTGPSDYFGPGDETEVEPVGQVRVHRDDAGGDAVAAGEGDDHVAGVDAVARRLQLDDRDVARNSPSWPSGPCTTSTTTSSGDSPPSSTPTRTGRLAPAEASRDVDLDRRDGDVVPRVGHPLGASSPARRPACRRRRRRWIDERGRRLVQRGRVVADHPRRRDLRSERRPGRRAPSSTHSRGMPSRIAVVEPPHDLVLEDREQARQPRAGRGAPGRGRPRPTRWPTRWCRRSTRPTSRRGCCSSAPR